VGKNLRKHLGETFANSSFLVGGSSVPSAFFLSSSFCFNSLHDLSQNPFFGGGTFLKTQNRRPPCQKRVAYLTQSRLPTPRRHIVIVGVARGGCGL